MKLRYVGLCLVGGSMVYVAMAACASPHGSPSPSGSTQVSGTGPSGAGGATVPGTTGASGTGTSGGGSLTNPVPSAHADATPGTRLKPMYRTGADGSKEYVAGVWFDSQRNENCSFATASDGQDRCLPDGASFLYFSDSACAKPLLGMKTGCTAPKYAVQASPPTCGSGAAGLEVFAVGEKITPAAIYGQSDGQCYNVGQVPPNIDYYAVGDQVPATSFVGAAIKHD